MSYNEVGWLPVRGLGAWPGACINSTSATSVCLSLALSLSLAFSRSLARSFFLPLSRSPRLRLTHPRGQPAPCFRASRRAPSFLVPSILFRLVRAPPVPTLRSRLPPSSRLDSSTLGAYESTQPDTTRIRRGEFGDPLPSASRRVLEGRARGRTRFKKT